MGDYPFSLEGWKMPEYSEREEIGWIWFLD